MSIISQYLWSLASWVVISYLLLLFLCLLFSVPRQKVKLPYIKILLIAYLIGICSQTIFPSLELGIDAVSNRPYLEVGTFFFTDRSQSINLIPFKTIYQMLIKRALLVSKEDAPQVIAANLLGNICLFLPLGILYPICGKRWRSLKSVTLLTLTFSIFLEVVQFFSGRSVDIDDILLRMVGVWIGYWLFCSLKKLRHFKANL